jgi:hypothetical protein
MTRKKADTVRRKTHPLTFQKVAYRPSETGALAVERGLGRAATPIKIAETFACS